MLSDVKGEGDPLVLVPGGLTGWLSWTPFAERLAPSRKVVRVQLLNVQSGLEGRALPADYSPRTEMLALTSTLQSLGLRPPIDFVGWSYGGEIAFDFALDNPEWVRTLTLIEPQAVWALPAGDENAARLQEEDLQMSRDDVTEDGLAHFLHRAGLVPPDINPRALPQWPLWVQHRQSLRAVPYIAEYQADRGRLSAYRRPTLLVKGTESTLLDRRIVDELAGQLHHSQVVELPGDHACHITSMDEFLEHMAAFQAGAA
jgi:pimeloyl-ACP methyl ester carboxylesterase